MLDEIIINGLREYLKDNYFPPHLPETEAIPDAKKLAVARSSYSRIYEIQGDINEAIFESQKSLRDISDDACGYIKKHRKPGGFAHALDRKRKEKGLTPAELYKRANVDRRHYSRLMGPEGRRPSMNTIISFALALRLERPEFDEFLQTAGYALSNASSRDVCIMYCLEKGIYDIDDVNTLLFTVGIVPLSRE